MPDMLQITEEGVITFKNMIVGEFDADDNRLVLNLAWVRMSGMKITVEGDPKVDRRRVVLGRPQDRKRLEGGTQLTIDE